LIAPPESLVQWIAKANGRNLRGKEREGRMERGRGGRRRLGESSPLEPTDEGSAETSVRERG